jgi:hypothetical protein
MKFRLTAATLVCAMTMIAAPAFSQNFDAAAEAKWSKVEIVHFEVVGEIADKHVQIPPVDADLYADVKDRVTLSFDWNRKKNIFVGLPSFQNHPGTATNLSGMQPSCKDGKINVPYEHFDIVEIKQAAPGDAGWQIDRYEGPEQQLGLDVHADCEVVADAAMLRSMPSRLKRKGPGSFPPGPSIFSS